jgi:multidrug efflux pump
MDQRKIDATAVIRRLQPQLAKVAGITLYMQPVQDLTVEDRVSRTQYQYTLEDADAEELNMWETKMVAKLRALPELRDVANDQQNLVLLASLIINRATAVAPWASLPHRLTRLSTMLSANDKCRRCSLN